MASPRERKARLLAAQDLQDFLELHAQLADDLHALRQVFLGFLAREALARAADGETLVVEQAADLADEQHVAPLVIAPVAATLDGLELRKFLLPVPQHVRLDAAELADFTDREVALARDGRQLVVIPRFQHRLPLES